MWEGCLFSGWISTAGCVFVRPSGYNAVVVFSHSGSGAGVLETQKAVFIGVLRQGVHNVNSDSNFTRYVQSTYSHCFAVIHTLSHEILVIKQFRKDNMVSTKTPVAVHLTDIVCCLA